MQKTLMRMAGSSLAQFLVNIVLYEIYAAVLGISPAPSAGILAWGFSSLPAMGGGSLGAGAAGIALLGLSMGLAYFIYLTWGSLIQALVIRLFSLGIKPGIYPMVSVTCLRWIIYSGVFTIAARTILPLTVMSFFCKLFFRIVGARIGKNVYINTPNLNDAQFLTLEGEAVVGIPSGMPMRSVARIERENR